MKLPTEAEVVEWAKREALRLPNEPTDNRKRLLVLLSIIKRLESRNRELEARSQSKETSLETVF